LVLDNDGAGVLHAKNADNIHYSDIEVNRLEAIAIWPHSLAPSIDRMPFTELLSVAASLGWDFSGNSLHLLDLQEAVRQAGADGTLTQLSQLGEKSEQHQRRHSGSFHYTALVGRRAMFSGAVIRGGFCGGRSSLSWRARSFWSAVSSV
jgi:hypothetical protein